MHDHFDLAPDHPEHITQMALGAQQIGEPHPVGGTFAAQAINESVEQLALRFVDGRFPFRRLA